MADVLGSYPGRRWDEALLLDLAERGRIATGMSSRALLTYAIDPSKPLRDRPYDRGDFGRCIDLYRMASPRLQEIMLPVMEGWAADLNREADERRERDPSVDWSWKRPQGWPL